MRNIEFVCTGNGERSPLAEAFARKYLDGQKLNYVQVSSSGTLVDFSKNPDEGKLATLMQQVLPLALERGFVTQEQADSVRQGRDLFRIKDMIFQKVKEREMEQKPIILSEKGLVAYFDTNRNAQQTVVRREAQFIFPIGMDNYDRTINIYSEADVRPIIEILGEIRDPIFATIDEYRMISDKIEEATNMVMGRVLG